MSTTTIEEDVTSFTLRNEEFVVIPKKEFQRLQDLEEYPKIYTQTDEEGSWETLDFWPEWIDPKQLINHLRS